MSELSMFLANLPSISRNQLVSGTGLLQERTIVELLNRTETWLKEDIYPSIFLDASREYDEEEGLKPFEGDFFARPLPGHGVLQQCHFKFHEIKDCLKTCRKKYEMINQKRNKILVREEAKKAKETKRSKAGADKWVALNDPEVRTEVTEKRLTRRNQINRKRKGIKKIKKDRSEGDMPEATWRSTGGQG